MNIEELAFKDRKILANLNEVDLLNIIEFLQDDRRQCLEELSKNHNRSVEIQKECEELKSILRCTTHCFDEEEHLKLKEEITNLSKDVDMWNAKYNDIFDENRMLKKQLEERPKEYVFIGNAQNKTRDFINQIIKDNKEFKNQQKELINYLEKEIKRINPNDLYISELNLRLDDIKFTQYLIYKETLQKYKEITGVSDENNIS